MPPTANPIEPIRTEEKPRTSERFVFVDALRGIAALAVVFDHVVQGSALVDVIWKLLPPALISLFLFGSHGVQIFFVISGFVIAHSLRSTSMSWRAILNFVVRRQLRLDPPYWTMIIVSWILWVTKSRFPVFHVDPIPTIGAIVANCFYLQRVFRLPEIVAVAWTLCIEIQFYLVFILLLMVLSRWHRHHSSTPRIVAAIIIALTGILAAFTAPRERLPVWFFSAWPYFTGGVLAYWTYQRKSPDWILALYLMVCGFAMISLGGDSSMVVGICSILALITVGRMGKLGSTLNVKWLQYLGMISYSLYLVHRAVTYIVMRTGLFLTGDNESFAVGWMVLSILTSVVAADILYRLVELPSKRWSSRLKTEHK